MTSVQESTPRSQKESKSAPSGRLTIAQKRELWAKERVSAPVAVQTLTKEMVPTGRPSRLDKRPKKNAASGVGWKTKPPKTTDTAQKSVITDLHSAKIQSIGAFDSMVCLDDGRKFPIANKKLKDRGISQIDGQGLFVRLGKSWAGESIGITDVLQWDKGVSLMKSAKA